MADEKKAQAKAFTARGTSRDTVDLPSDIFDGTVHMPAMHQAVKAYLANQRQGTAKTKTRSYVAGGNQKPWKQKGTGRARQGSIRAPNWVGGGTVFGPIPRSYAQYVPRQVRALARKSAFNARARENAIVVVDLFDFDSPKTKNMIALVDKVGGADKKVLVLTNGPKPNVFLSGRNLPNVHVMPYSDVSTYHILWSDLVVIEEGALTADDGQQQRTATADNEGGDGGEDSGATAPAKKSAVKKVARPTGSKKTSAAKQKAKAKRTATRAAKKATRQAAKPEAKAKPERQAVSNKAAKKAARGAAKKKEN